MDNTSPDRERPSWAPKLLRRFAGLAILLLALSLFANKIADTDIWWHLRTGRYIIENHVIPRVDMYSYTAGGNRWIDLHWLFQVIVYATFNALGSYGLSLLFISVFVFSFLLLRSACLPQRNYLAAIILFALAIMAASGRFLARPEAFTFLMIAAYMAILCRYERGGANRLVYLLIPLQILWTNMQGLFIIGPFLISAYILDRGIRRFVSGPESRESEKRSKGFRTLLVVLIGSLFACLINPYGFSGLAFPLTLFTRVGGMQNVFAASIAEFQPPFSGYNLTGSIRWFGVFMVISALAVAADYRNIKISHVVIFLGLGYLALNARRNIPLFVLATLPLSVEHAGNLVVRLGDSKGGKSALWVKRLELTGCAALILLIPFQICRVVNGRYYVSDRRAERFGFGFKEQLFPRGAFVFIKENGIHGPLFNNMDIGGMFIYEMYPMEKVFIDARLEVNSAEHLVEYRRVTADPVAFRRLALKHGFNAAVIAHTSQDALYLMPVLYFSPDWALVYLDPIAAVFVRTVPENEVIIRSDRIDIGRRQVPLIAPDDTLNDSGPIFLRAFLDAITPSATTDSEAHNWFNLGLVYLVMGQNARAAEHMKSGLKLMPFSSEAEYNLGLAYDRMGEKGMALQHYGKAIVLNARHARAHANIGRIYDERGLKREAEQEYNLALRYGGENPIVLYNLGALSYERGEYETAREWWQRALKEDSAFQPAIEALKKLN
ncbi:tetratricopeptide repeat protein [Candidatus Poribacteria bacterium]|nr:tetratricopeptide repeat protein [Candidatus Poribacteria bacterium]